MPGKPAPCREGTDGSEGLKSGVVGDGLLPPGNIGEIPTPAAAPVCWPRCPWAVCHGVAL